MIKYGSQRFIQNVSLCCKKCVEYFIRVNIVHQTVSLLADLVLRNYKDEYVPWKIVNYLLLIKTLTSEGESGSLLILKTSLMKKKKKKKKKSGHKEYRLPFPDSNS